jgi:hypothetical protein
VSSRPNPSNNAVKSLNAAAISFCHSSIANT